MVKRFCSFLLQEIILRMLTLIAYTVYIAFIILRNLKVLCESCLMK